jgi:hypothetical protein
MAVHTDAFGRDWSFFREMVHPSNQKSLELHFQQTIGGYNVFFMQRHALPRNRAVPNSGASGENVGPLDSNSNRGHNSERFSIFQKMADIHDGVNTHNSSNAWELHANG